MSETRTKLDILYQDVLGDIKEILDHMDQLKSDLPNSMDEAIAIIQLQNKHITSSAEKLNESVNDITKRIDAYVSSAALSAGDAARVEVRQGVAQILNTLIYESLLPIIQKATTNSNEFLDKLMGISNDIENKMTSDAEKAIDKLNAAINSVQKAVKQEAEKIEENKWDHMLHSGIGAFIGTGLAIGISTVLYLLLK